MTTTNIARLALALTVTAAFACKNGGNGDDTAATGETGDTGPDYVCPLVEGFNQGWEVDAMPRDFFLDLPDNVEDGGPWPVVFSYHGLGDTADNFRGLFDNQVDNADYPFILVTPEDTDLTVLGFVLMDWEVSTVDAATNRETRFFDQMLETLEGCYGVDEDRVHAAGFSMGGFCADMIGVTRGDEVASVVSWSGGYGSNPANESLLGPLSNQVNWPAPIHTNPYPQMLVHGGATDTYNAGIFLFEIGAASPNDVTYLNGMGHDTVICDHGNGHTVPYYLSGAQAVDFFAEHPRGTVDSPYGTAGLPDYLPAYCTFSPAL